VTCWGRQSIKEKERLQRIYWNNTLCERM
jgi:hypothetical protein